MMKTKVTKTQIEKEYELGVMVYKDQLAITQAVQILVQDYKMNKNTALMNIDSLLNMLKGESFRNILSKAQKDYFLKMTEKEFDENFYQKAVSTLKQNIEQYLTD